MCGRATDTQCKLPGGEDFGMNEHLWIRPRFDIRPTDPIRILREIDGVRDHRAVRWGLVPFFAKAGPTGLPDWKAATFNARIEGIEKTSSFRYTLRRRRCLVLIDGFFEWTGEKGKKTKHFISLPGRAPMALAGLWDRWTSGDGSHEVTSCTMLTRAAGPFMRRLHTREIILLPEGDHAAWLDRENPDYGAILDRAGEAPLEEHIVRGDLKGDTQDSPTALEPLAA